MGVHTTFVRSVDLDEWTQRQIDAMRLGGNANAASYLRKNGCTDLHGKIDKKYKSKAAQTYRVELEKLVNAEAAKRGEAVAETISETSASSLLENLSLADAADNDKLARDKLAAARAAAAQPAQPSNKLASQLPGAKGKLVTPPSSGNAPKVVLRKPASNVGKNFLKKKSSSGLTKLRVNKLSSNVSSSSAAGSDDGFEDVEATQAAVAKAEEEAKQVEADEALARKLQEELAAQPPVPEPVVAAAPVPVVAATKSPVSPKPAVSSMEEGLSKLKAMNNDFFAGM